MTTDMKSTSSTAVLVDPYGGLHHRNSTTTTSRALSSPEHDNCPQGGENGNLPRNISSSSPQRCLLAAFQRNNDSSSNSDNENGERKGHPIAAAAAARRRAGNYFAISMASLVSIVLLPRTLWNQLYRRHGPNNNNNFNDYKASINQQQQQQHQQFSRSKRIPILLMGVIIAIIASIMLLPRWRLVVGEEEEEGSHSIQSSLLSSALHQCSSSSSSSFMQQQQQPNQQTKSNNNNSNNNNKSSTPSSSASNKYILVASHLRAGSDGQLRLRIIEHNLRMLSYSTSSSATRAQQQQPTSSSTTELEEYDHETTTTITTVLPKKMECMLIFSLDEKYNTTIRAMVQNWQNSISSSSSSSSTNIISKSMNINVLYVPNDNILVDASKWMIGLYLLLPSLIIEQNDHLQQDIISSSRIMLINDSFLLTRPIPELWDTTICGSVCGLVWTAAGPGPGPPSNNNNGKRSDDPHPTTQRHIQSYIRTLDTCAILKYMNFYERNKKLVHNVNELIVLFEINLDWAATQRQHEQPEGVDDNGNSWWSRSLLLLLRGSRSNDGGDKREEYNNNNNNRDVTALYEYAGGHPDDEYVQHVLLTNNYPAIKLKKFFITNDPWLFAVLDKKEKEDHNNITTPLMLLSSSSSEKEKDEMDLPPSFSTTIYRRTNHDLNHLSDNDLCNHFRTSGKYENRIYSNSLPLVMKGWLRIELERMEKEYNNYIGVDNNSQASMEDEWERGGERRQADTIIAILDDYLVALNRDILGK